MDRLKIFSIIILLFLPILYINAQKKIDFYAAGMAEYDNGDWKTALNIWSNGKIVLSGMNVVDSRIGIAYADVAVSSSQKEYYKKATEMYMWSLSGQNDVVITDAVRDEIKRINPLLSSTERDEWNDLVHENNHEIFNKMRRFWIEKDPTLSSPVNERLIEHWQRIAYARRHFTRAKNSPYGTDDRGTIYVKYGKPNRVTRGTLGSDVSELTRRFFELENDSSFDEMDTAAKYESSMRSHRQTDMRSRNKMTYERPSAGYYHSLQWNPEYEIWSYEDISENKKIVFMFGKPEYGHFKLIKSVEELIPRVLFSSRYELLVKKGNSYYPFSPGILIQLMYYHQLMMESGEFVDRYDELYYLWNANDYPPSPGMVRTYRDRFLMEDRYDTYKLSLPEDISTFNMVTVPVQVLSKQVRILDENNEPYLSVITFSKLEKDAFKDYETYAAERLSRIAFRPAHYLVIRDEYGNEICRLHDTEPDLPYNISSFVVKHDNYVRDVSISSESYAKIPAYQESDSLVAIPFIGRKSFGQIAPLESDPTQLEISDLITGIIVPDSLQLDNYIFPVLPSEKFLKSTPLVVYVELYHLKKGIDNWYRYKITFELERPENEKLWKRLLEKHDKPVVSQTVTLESQSDRAYEYITFDISDLEPGVFAFKVTVQDLTTGQSKSRKGEFSIIKSLVSGKK